MTNSIFSRRFEALSEDTAPSTADLRYRPVPNEGAERSGANDDGLDRNVYCMQGVPIDAVNMQETMLRLLSAMSPQMPFLLSTPNLNFLVSSNANLEFRESLRISDLCPPDGVSLIWIARLLGIPLQGRVAGADIFEAFVEGESRPEPLKVFFFGGAEGVAAAAEGALNSRSVGVRCVGWLNPGFGTVDEMSRPHILDQINASGAQLLIVALGANKGQAWLKRNHHKIRIPVRSHLGAAIGFQAGAIKRAPCFVGRLGFEWLWRIKEEPYLWKRYAKDGSALAALLISRLAPLAVLNLINSFAIKVTEATCLIDEARSSEGRIVISGRACACAIPELKTKIRKAIISADHIDVDLSNLYYIDSRVLGLLLVARKYILGRNGTFRISGVSVRARLLFWLHGMDDLLRPVEVSDGKSNSVRSA